VETEIQQGRFADRPYTPPAEARYRAGAGQE